MTIINILDSFTRDIIVSIPEYAVKGQLIRDLFKSENSKRYETIFLQHFLSCIGNRDNLIMNKNEEFFTKETGSGRTDLIKGLDLAPYWTEFSDDTKEIVWKYIMGILVVSSHMKPSKKQEQNGLNPEMIQNMLKKLKEETTNDTTHNDFFKGLVDGKIGSLAKEIGEDVDVKEFAESIGIKENEEGDPMEFIQKLTTGKGGEKMGELMQKIGGKVASKIQNGEINIGDMMGDVMKAMGSGGNNRMGDLMKNMMGNMGNMNQNMKGNMDNMGDMGKMMGNMMGNMGNKNPHDMIGDMMKMMGNLKNNPMMSAVAGMVNQQMKRSNHAERLRKKLEMNQKENQQQEEANKPTEDKKKTRRGNRGGKKKKN